MDEFSLLQESKRQKKEEQDKEKKKEKKKAKNTEEELLQKFVKASQSKVWRWNKCSFASFRTNIFVFLCFVI